MDKYDLIKKCKESGLDIEKHISGENEMAYKLVTRLCSSYRFIELRNELINSSIYYYLVLSNAYLLIENRDSHEEMFCKCFTIDEIEPIFSFDEKFISSEFPNLSQEWVEEYLSFIKRIKEDKIELKEITLDNKFIKSIQVLLCRYYQQNPIHAKMAQLTSLHFLDHIKMDKPIKCVETDECMGENSKAIVLFNILIVLTKEDKEKVNDFIINNLMNILNTGSYIYKGFLDKIPQEISSILAEQKETQYIDISIQKKLIDFFVKHQATENLYVDYCEELKDYIFENYIYLLKNLKSWCLIPIIIRNINKIDKLTETDDIQAAMEIIERALNYELWQYNNEIGRCVYDKKKFSKIHQMVSQIWNEVPEVRDCIKTFTPEQTINSLYLIDCYFKRTKYKNKRLVDRFNSLIKEDFVDMFAIIKDKNALETAYKKIRNKSIEIVYEEEIREIKEMIDVEYKKYVEEFHKSKKYSFEKYYERVEVNLNNETDFYKFVKNKEFDEMFNKIVLTYNAKEIKELLASNEYYYTQLQEVAEGCELTPLMTCLIKAIEQFMCACIKYAYNKGWCATDVIYDKYEHKLNSINWEKTKITCTPLKIFIEDNILNNENNNINDNLKIEIVKSLENFIDKVRNGHFHKDNVFGICGIMQYVKEAYNTISGLIAMITYLEENG